MLLMVILILLPVTAFAGSCQGVGGTVKCTDETGHNPTLNHWIYRSVDPVP